MLRDLPGLKAVYCSETDNILEDFYLPALNSAVSYDRAVGFFSASMIAYAAQGLSALIRNGGTMRLVIGAELTPDEERSILYGYEERNKLLAESVSKRVASEMNEAIETVADPVFLSKLEGLSWLVKHGKLDVRVAVRRKGMYHEKIGIIRDSNGDKLVFQGSANESVRALLPDFNYESINVFPSWRPELKDHFQPHIDSFERLWNRRSANTLIVDFPDAVRQNLLRRAPARAPQPEIEKDVWQQHLSSQKRHTERYDLLPRVPVSMNGQEFKIEKHQRVALQKWKANHTHGILQLATGSGKTITAIYGSVKLFEALKRLFLVIAVPYQNLADQWVDNLSLFNINAIECYAGEGNWLEALRAQVALFRAGSAHFVTLVVVNRTLQNQSFQQLLSNIDPSVFLFVGDECHNHNSLGMQNSLPQNAGMRLGLSATVEGAEGPEDDMPIKKYYGPVVEEYSLERALNEGVLTPYRYHVVRVYLTENEGEEYRKLTSEIGRLIASSKKPRGKLGGDPRLESLLFARARLLGAARNKLVELERILRTVPVQKHTLFYCSDGSIEDEANGDEIRQIEAVSLIAHSMDWKTSRFTSRETRDERKRILEGFRMGEIDGMVAIKCLDEGIDVPACSTAFILASSRNPRQFIQRRGRILRKFSGKTFATIYDFMVMLADDGENEGDPESADYSRNLLKNELKRVAEFSRLSMNRHESYEVLRPLLEAYDLAHLLV